MKTKILIGLLVLSIVLLSGCNTKDNTESIPNNSTFLTDNLGATRFNWSNESQIKIVETVVNCSEIKDNYSSVYGTNNLIGCTLKELRDLNKNEVDRILEKYRITVEWDYFNIQEGDI